VPSNGLEQNLTAVAEPVTAPLNLTGELLLLDPPGALPEPHAPSEVVAQRDSTFRRLLGTADILSAMIALVATATFTHTSQVYWSMFVAVLFVVPIGKLMGLYDRDAQIMNHTTLDEAPKLFTLATMTALVAFFARDLAESGVGPHPRDPITELTRERIASHIDWRLANGLIDPGELTRSSLHLSRFAEWLVAAGLKTEAEFAEFRPWMRAQAAGKIAAAPPAFHVAADATALRDTSGDEQILQPKPSADA
jgi:hypothetical protein